MKPLQGRVAPATTGSTVPDATTLAHHSAIVAAAQTYVAALLEWENPESYNETRHKALVRARKALVDAVESQR